MQFNWLKTKIQTIDASFPRAPLCLWPGTVLKSSSRSHIGVDIHNTAGSSVHGIRTHIATARNFMALLDRNICHSSIFLPPSYDSIESYPSSHSLWTRNMVPYPTDNSRGIWMCFTSGACSVYYAFPGRPASQMRRSANVLISHHSHTSSVPPASSSSVTLHVPIHLYGPQSSPWDNVAHFPRDWNRRSGRPRHTWLRTVESNLAPLDIGLATADRRAQNRQAWSALHARRNGNVQYRTSHMMMMMISSAVRDVVFHSCSLCRCFNRLLPSATDYTAKLHPKCQISEPYTNGLSDKKVGAKSQNVR